MTGTAVTEAGEFWEIYKLDVVEIPTNRPIARDDREDLVYKTKREKYNAVIEEVTKLSQEGRPVLIGVITSYSIHYTKLYDPNLPVKYDFIQKKLRKVDVVKGWT